VQKALAPIVEKLQRITERDDRTTNTFYRRPSYDNHRTMNMSYRRPNYNNDNREQNARNYNNNTNDPFRCFTCGQTGHIARACPTKQTYPRNPVVPTTQEPARVVQPQANVTTNESVNQIPLNDASGRTFVTQQEEVGQPTAADWRKVQHLNY
jgi:hypothetical protein